MKRFAWGALIGVAMAVVGTACGGSGGDAGVGDAAGGGTSDQQSSHSDGGPGLEGSTAESSTDGGTDAGTDGGSTDSGLHDATGGQDAVEEPGPFSTAPHPAWPIVAPNGGVVLHDMKLVIVATSGDANASDYFAFGDALIGSAWWQSFSTEYGLGTPSASIHVTGPAITTDPDSATMIGYISSAVAAESDAGAAANGETMYMLFLPTGIDIYDDSHGAANTNCQYYGGYHTTYDKSGDAWGVVQHCPLTNTGLTDLEWMTIGASHEIAEAATDPIPVNGYSLYTTIDYTTPWTQSPWATALYGEVGDMCVDTKITEGSFTYQRIWSVAAAAKGLDPCVPPYAQYAYVNASVPQGWYPVAAGGSTQVTVTGWSDRPASDWIIAAGVYTSNVTTPAFTATLTSPTTLKLGTSTYYSTNNGGTSTLTLSAPAGATPGSWATVYIVSEPTTAAGDTEHLWITGIYVP